MKGVIAIARRDLASTFLVPTGWIILAGWGLVASIIFAFASLREGEPATLRAVVSMAGWAIAVVAPAISMRSFAEEARLGTLEVLLTSPLSALELVLGKFLAGVGVLLVLGIPILVLFGVAEIYGDPDPGELASGLLGLLLAGATLIALGLVVSTRTSSQVVAYLVTFFIFFAVVLVAKGVPVLIEFLPADLLAPERTLAWIEWASGLDPLLRLDEFAIGLFDSANVGWFIAASAFFLFLGGFSLAAPRRVRAASRAGRLVAMLLAAAGILGAAVSAIAFSTLMEAPPLRVEADLTKTRAYSLQASTVELLESLEPGWSVRLLVARDDADPVTMRQVDEVVQRMDQVTPSLEAERIDPVDPRSIGRYEAVLESLLSRDAATIAIWEEKIQAGVDAFEALQAVGREVAPSAAALLPQIPADSPIHSLIERVGLVFGTLADQGGAFTAFIDETLRSTSRRPLPNWRLAQASLAANNAKQAGEIEQVADVLRQWEIDPGIPAAARDWAALTIPAIESVAVVLRASGDELAVLEEAHPLVAAVIAESIAEGDVAIVDGPRGSLVIPAWQLFPASAVRQGGDGAVVGFDRRFQGEETLAAAIRALQLGRMPRVVFVHAEDRSLLRDRDDGLEVAGITNALRTARFEVAEWIPGRTERPLAAPERTTVWFVLPPLQRKGLEYGDPEKALLGAATGLIAEGEPVLLTVARSMLPLVGKPDPWSTVASTLGVEIDTARVVFEWMPDMTEGGSVKTWQEIDGHPPADSASGGAIIEALRGKRLFVSHATPIRVDSPKSSTAVVLAEVRPSALRWLEDDWRGDGVQIEEMPGGDRFTAPIPVAVAVEAMGENGMQRLVAVGSGGWALSALVNEAGTLGGDRLVLTNPGNRELALSSIAWLAGLDDLVATAATGREISRFSGLSNDARAGWGLALTVFLGLGPMLLGTIVWSMRRATS
ncbi:MAG: ABC transporter permease subunit [Phycisphaerales bacterium]|jgi:ABC-2 type transport system permease protein|nr:ABC transporter permease subunit [Phycisphaerales bacterium]